MQIEPILSYHNVDRSPAVDELVHRRIAMLEKRDDRITGCEVTLEAPQKKMRHGRVFRVRLNLHMPGPDLSISREISQGSAQDDLILAVNRAFSAAEKALKKRKKVMAGIEVKHHPPVLHGAIVELEPELGHGWLEADDGRRVYFQRDGLTSQDWDRLQTGTRLRFREMIGEKGPYATGVTIAERA
ncbi:HPF/RaiA family ribosome-associated protein [Jannaschia seohaensis]|uniref:Ribosome-associated translation inhibitor RaiA n=1 Tax=Jannaschia seohaensis TaxID=475081 RepID=A0A2Y9AJJ2_9RHOB|nr:HPF/RaiA family ribosome-associated protein [Jannaschia seohaensis]PWJ20575.1 ribosome-associated translation inhibitor RaiA [Jannaschia seohaensis]SSA44671.1 Ribosome-associated translation inhibitor RaiA [Jannaschia seohaensis]